jgi:biopolymer transport protein ExbD
MLSLRTPKLTEQAARDVDLKPFINFLVILIPVLMLSAEFSNIAIVKATAPERGTNTDSLSTQPPLEPATDKLDLTVFLTDSTVTVAASGGFMPTMWYKEFDRYVSREDRRVQQVEAYDPRDPEHVPLDPRTNHSFTVSERQERLLYVADGESRVLLDAYYLKATGGLLTDDAGETVRSVTSGDSVYTVSDPPRLVIVHEPAAEVELRHLSVCDQLGRNLMAIKRRFPAADDAGRITIASDRGVAYDKIIQVMDAARNAGFADIGIARVRA